MISDEMIKVAEKAYNIEYDKCSGIGMKAALEAVFDHIADASKVILDKSECPESHKADPKLFYMCDKCEITIAPQDEPNKLDGGWVSHDGTNVCMCPVDEDLFIEIKTRSGAIGKGVAGKFLWIDRNDIYSIVAYRIIENEFAPSKKYWDSLAAGHKAMDKLHKLRERGKEKKEKEEESIFDSQNMHHGLYKIYWKEGGCSLASVGSLHSGKRWFAPCNWTSANHDIASSAWNKVKHVELVMSTSEINRYEDTIDKLNDFFGKPVKWEIRKDNKESKKQALLEFIGNKQNKQPEQIWNDRDDYTRWLVGEISEWIETRLSDLEQR